MVFAARPRFDGQTNEPEEVIDLLLNLSGITDCYWVVLDFEGDFAISPQADGAGHSYDVLIDHDFFL